MAAPVVSRPPATAMDTDDTRSGFTLADKAQWAHWAKWIVLTLIVLGVVALIVVAIVMWRERGRVDRLRKQWDKVYVALKGKEKPDDEIAAYEALAESLKGSPAHAYVLMELGRLHFGEAVNAVKPPADRQAALEKATKLYQLVATTEPYASNPDFGPVAVEGYALALEQDAKYDAAIALLEENLPKLDKQSHFLYAKLAAQLGRVYWLRSRNPTAEPKSDPVKDAEKARDTLAEVLRVTAGKDEKSKWREQAEYIKSLVDKRGKALPEGAPIPALKPPPPPPTPPVAPKADEKAEPKKGEAKKEEPKKEEPKKDEAKKEEAKKEEAKKN